MKITSINIKGFGKFENKAIDFTNGINVVYGKNEAGKSTTHSFIKAMLFGMKKNKLKSKITTYSKFLPWNKNIPYEGYLCFDYKNKSYQIYRKFSEHKPILEVRDIKNGVLLEEPDLFLNKVLCNLTIDSFDNTISIGQLNTTQDKSIANDLQKYISNLNTSGDMSINTTSAINFLKRKKENLSLNLKSDAVISYNRQLANIRTIEKELSSQEFTNLLPDIMNKKNSESKKIESNDKEIEELKSIIATSTVKLESFGFMSNNDIDMLKNETEKMYLEFSPIRNTNSIVFKIFINIIFSFLGLIILIFNTILLFIAYPTFADILNLPNLSSTFSFMTQIIFRLPFHPSILIGFLYSLSLLIIIGNLLLLIINYQNIKKSNDLYNILSDIFDHHINDNEVDDLNMNELKKHLKNMKKLATAIEESESRIVFLTQENNQLLANLNEYEEKIKSQQKKQFDVEQKYNELNKLRIENEKIKQDITINDNLTSEIDSIDMAIDTLNELSDRIQVMFGTHLNKSVSKHIDGLTDGKYRSLNVDNGLNITINHNEQIIPLSMVSTGTMDQVYLAMRLATAEIICGNKEALPLLFDDCFAMYDNDRLVSSLNYLNSSFNTQIIIFTCHTREAGLLGLNKIDFNKIEI